MIWTKRQFELGAARLHAQCAERKRERKQTPKNKRSLALNADEVRFLANMHSLGNGGEIDKNMDIEIYAMNGSRCFHVVITENGDMYRDGWLVNSIPKPDIKRLFEHYKLPSEEIKRLHKEFERKKCSVKY